MLHVKSPEETSRIIARHFGGSRTGCEFIPLRASLGRILYEDITSKEYVPDFNRSSMDGYAVRSADTFGCSDSLPSLLRCVGEADMGKELKIDINSGECLYVHTGGEIPQNSDGVVMVEYTEDYGDGTIGIFNPCAPGENIVLKGDDTSPGKKIYVSGHCINPHDIGALSALGETAVPVYKKPVVGIISTGNELVSSDLKPGSGQMRDVNSNMLEAAVTAAGGQAHVLGISPDDEDALRALITRAGDCDMILISGGSSAGTKDVTMNVINNLGETYIHGIAIKPGKPTIIGAIDGKPVFGLPGHPVAAYFVFENFVCPLICTMGGAPARKKSVEARLDTVIPSNHGREEYVAVKLNNDTADGVTVTPVRGKSGLITLLAGTQGYITVPRDCEGFPKKAVVTVNLYSGKE